MTILEDPCHNIKFVLLWHDIDRELTLQHSKMDVVLQVGEEVHVMAIKKDMLRHNLVLSLKSSYAILKVQETFNYLTSSITLLLDILLSREKLYVLNLFEHAFS